MKKKKEEEEIKRHKGREEGIYIGEEMVCASRAVKCVKCVK